MNPAESEEPLLTVANLVEDVTNNDELLFEAIKVAENKGWME